MNTTPDNRLIDAWNEFCDRLKLAGRLPLRQMTPKGSLDQAAGFRLLARNVALALQFNYENADSLNPEIMHFFDPIHKQGGDNNDALYCYAPINGTDTYRISGTLGSARYVSFALVDDGPTPWGGGVTVLRLADTLDVAADGTFELTISPHPSKGNWLQSTVENYRVVIRQFFADWENEQPMRVRIDRISTDELPCPELSAEKLARGLIDSAAWLHNSLEYFLDAIEKWQVKPNQYLSFAQIDGKMGATPGGISLVAYWQLPPDEVIVIRVYPPAARYWAVEFGNYWWETMDYRYHLSSTNIHYAALEADGELIVVISHDDPGLPNWLDTSGFSAGYSIFRWMGTDDYPQPACRQVKRSELWSLLPTDVRRITSEARKAQLIGRRRGALNRFA
jgi:hypothetical protein